MRVVSAFFYAEVNGKDWVEEVRSVLQSRPVQGRPTSTYGRRGRRPWKLIIQTAISEVASERVPITFDAVLAKVMMNENLLKKRTTEARKHFFFLTLSGVVVGCS